MRLSQRWGSGDLMLTMQLRWTQDMLDVCKALLWLCCKDEAG